MPSTPILSDGKTTDKWNHVSKKEIGKISPQIILLVDPCCHLLQPLTVFQYRFNKSMPRYTRS